MKNIIAIVLAAGKGTRMKSGTPKVMHKILGRPMIFYVLDALKRAGIADIIVIAGHDNAVIKEAVKKDARVLVQKRPLGSGDALNTAKGVLRNYSGDIVVTCGDAPLIRSDTIKDIISRHKSSGASATVLTVDLKDPTGYGRVIRRDGSVLKIIEEANANFDEKDIGEINVGTYCFRAKDIFDALSRIKPDNKKKEYFLTDSLEVLNKTERRVGAVKIKDPKESIGINTRKDLADATGFLKNMILEELMSKGVTIQDPLSTVIYPDVKIGQDTVIFSNTVVESDVEIGRRGSVGPFARIRCGVRLDDDVEVGNFVELVRTRIGAKTRVKHHTYLGDAIVGKNVNIGAGTITANFDGKNKNRTVIEDGASIGVGARLIAPVKVGKCAIVGAGSVLPKNHNVPRGATVVGVPAKIIRRAIP